MSDVNTQYQIYAKSVQ